MLIGRLKALGIGAALGAATMLVAACGGGGSTASTATPAASTPATGASAGATKAAATAIPTDIGKSDKANITGAGSTFAAPLYQGWFDSYAKTVAPSVKLNYQAIGSGAGIQQFTSKTIDFGATDVPMTDQQMKDAPGTQHLPTVLGSVVVTYNIAGVTTPLKLDGPTLAKIYLGTITKWNDPAIAALNAGVTLPSANILVVYRSDGSGTSGVFTDYLSKQSPDWKTKVGASTNPNWPTGQGGKGSDGVTQVVKQTPNAIGYVELTYALTNKLPFADMKNKAGKFVTATIASTSAAAAGVTIPADYRVSITDADGDASYPIATFTFIVLPTNAASCATEKPIVDAFWWALHDPAAAKIASDLFYAPLPAAALPQVDSTFKALQCEGKPIFAS